MATLEGVETISVQVATSGGVASALLNRFVIWQPTAPVEREVITHVPGAFGAAAIGILAQKPDTRNVPTGYVQCAMVVPNEGIAIVELGEAVTTVGQKLRVGGNAAEIDGAAYLADATGDFIVAYALETGAVGEVIQIQFVGFAGTF